MSRRKKKNDFASQSLFDLDFDDEKDTSNSQKTASKVQYQMFEEI